MHGRRPYAYDMVWRHTVRRRARDKVTPAQALGGLQKRWTLLLEVLLATGCCGHRKQPLLGACLASRPTMTRRAVCSSPSKHCSTAAAPVIIPLTGHHRFATSACARRGRRPCWSSTRACARPTPSSTGASGVGAGARALGRGSAPVLLRVLRGRAGGQGDAVALECSLHVLFFCFGGKGLAQPCLAARCSRGGGCAGATRMQEQQQQQHSTRAPAPQIAARKPTPCPPLVLTATATHRRGRPRPVGGGQGSGARPGAAPQGAAAAAAEATRCGAPGAGHRAGCVWEEGRTGAGAAGPWRPWWPGLACRLPALPGWGGWRGGGRARGCRRACALCEKPASARLQRPPSCRAPWVGRPCCQARPASKGIPHAQPTAGPVGCRSCGRVPSSCSAWPARHACPSLPAT